MALSTISGGSLETVEKSSVRTRFQISRQFMIAAVICLLSWILLLISFAAPYWLSSYKLAYSSFIRLGLWDFCFYKYTHPPYQYADKFTGCHWIYSSKYQNIRDWLQPGWFIFVQALVTFSFVFTTISLILIAACLMYYLIRVQVTITAVIAGLQASSAFLLLLSVSVFAGKAFDRNWLQYPNFNHLDWAFYTAIVALLFHIVSAYLMFSESLREHHRRRKMNNLVYNMQSRSQSNGNSQETRPMMTESSDTQPPFRPHYTQV